MEISFLVALASADNNISQLAAKGLCLICHAEHQPDAPPNLTITDEDRSQRNLIYEQLGDPRVTVVADPQADSNVIVLSWNPRRRLGGVLKDRIRVIQCPLPLVEDFVGNLINLLVAGDIHIQDVVRDALGSELSPRLYGKLIRNLES
ncbi:hypothetical protein BYT27DRAFT_7257917 [Phlegmacium glaucopus]|nr:hypothetical protein BYT27DRAFT_7257917 [Phlegmacium glaucopus]